MEAFRFALLAAAISCFGFPSTSQGEPPSKSFRSFAAAKKVARDGIYAGHHEDFYCGCAWTPNKTGTSGKIDLTAWGYKPRRNKARRKLLGPSRYRLSAESTLLARSTQGQGTLGFSYLLRTQVLKAP